jgi:CubicO group peptidase (beta-lactamase class C family)
MRRSGLALLPTLIWAAVVWMAPYEAVAQSATVSLDKTLIERIDRFVSQEVQSSAIPGVALAVLHDGRLVHSRGFGHDGHGQAVTADTLFPIGSLTKSFTALLVRQQIQAGKIDPDAPVQRYLPWFAVHDTQDSARITVRHLLNQTSGFSRADGITPLVERSQASTQAIARGLSRVALNRPVGTRYEYSNLNFVVLGALLEQVSGRPWADLVREQVLLPVGMQRTTTDGALARQSGMTAVHRYWFGWPVQYDLPVLPGLAPAGNLVSTANDMARYLQMMLTGGATSAVPVLAPEGIAQLLAPASPPAHAHLLSMDFSFRYGEGWFVGPFGAAADARWHMGSLSPFVAWMVLLPDTKQAVVVLINANNEPPFGSGNTALSRLPIGVVNLLRGAEPPSGTSIRQAYVMFDLIVGIVAGIFAILAWLVLRAWDNRRGAKIAVVLMAMVALALAATPRLFGLSGAMIWQFAPDFALAGALFIVLLAIPALIRTCATVLRLVGREPVYRRKQ